MAPNIKGAYDHTMLEVSVLLGCLSPQGRRLRVIITERYVWLRYRNRRYGCRLRYMWPDLLISYMKPLTGLWEAKKLSFRLLSALRYMGQVGRYSYWRRARAMDRALVVVSLARISSKLLTTKLSCTWSAAQMGEPYPLVSYLYVLVIPGLACPKSPQPNAPIETPRLARPE